MDLINTDSVIEDNKRNIYSQLSPIIENVNSLNERPHMDTSVGHSDEEEEEEEEEVYTNVLTDSSSDITDTDEESEALKEARRQWEESLVQLNQVVNWVILPLLGKFLGRRMAIWTWKWVANRLYK